MSLIELAERVEKASGPSHELDLAIATASYELGFPIYGERVNYDPAFWLERNGPISASLDAAMTLVGETDVWGVSRQETRPNSGYYFQASVMPFGPVSWAEAKAATPALALCAAALRARAQQEQTI